MTRNCSRAALAAASLIALTLAGCDSGAPTGEVTAPPAASAPTPTPSPVATATPSAVSPPVPTNIQARPGYYIGGDLSYVNSLEGCGAQYRINDAVVDPLAIFHVYGANTVRVRLFVDPTGATRSDLADATRTVRRAKAAGMQVLLDLHYSDTFADPGRQTIPRAWATLTQAQLVQRVRDYTYDVLTGLDAQGVMPELVQIGNETNSNILRAGTSGGFPLNWARNAPLFNAGIAGARAAGANSPIKPKIILHIAQPENIDWWFTEARANGVTDYDMIGVSYYPPYSTTPITGIGALVRAWRTKFGKDVLFVETAYPFTFDYADSTNNLLWTDALEPGFAATPEGQRDFLIQLTQSVISAGGRGVITWEPAWIAANCPFAYGTGSSWENATHFDFRQRNAVHTGITWMSHNYTLP